MKIAPETKPFRCKKKRESSLSLFTHPRVLRVKHLQGCLLVDELALALFSGPVQPAPPESPHVPPLPPFFSCAGRCDLPFIPLSPPCLLWRSPCGSCWRAGCGAPRLGALSRAACGAVSSFLFFFLIFWIFWGGGERLRVLFFFLPKFASRTKTEGGNERTRRRPLSAGRRAGPWPWRTSLVGAAAAAAANEEGRVGAEGRKRTTTKKKRRKKKVKKCDAADSRAKKQKKTLSTSSFLPPSLVSGVGKSRPAPFCRARLFS